MIKYYPKNLSGRFYDKIHRRRQRGARLPVHKVLSHKNVLNNFQKVGIFSEIGVFPKEVFIFTRGP